MEKKNAVFTVRVLMITIVSILLSHFILAESFSIGNLGLSSTESTNQEYTMSRTVVLNVNITDNATRCRYANEDLTYFIWESCTPIKYWLLTSGIGDKTVHIQINHTNDMITYYNDSIHYDYTGAGLDTTAPGNVTIIARNYTNNNQTITAEWTQSLDPESEMLDIPLVYEYKIQLNGADNNTWTSASERKLSYNINTTDNDNVTILIRTTNSAGLQTINNHTIQIDLIAPSTPGITSSFDEISWYNSITAAFNWSASDNNEMLGYSYTLSQNSATQPDDIPEGIAGQTQSHISKTFSTKNDGIYYFRIKAIDAAGNPSSTATYLVMIDNTVPKKPVMDQATQYVSTSLINFTWTHTEDISGTEHYEIQVSNTSDFSAILNTTNTTNKFVSFILSSQGTYYARVRAKNTAELNSIWSNEKETDFDNTPPVITLISPQAGAVSNDHPRVIVRTDEKAICYDLDSNKIFTFTNSTYHETRIDISSDNNRDILCADENNNSDTISTGVLNLDLGAVPSITPGSSTVFTNILAKINLSTNGFYGFENDDFNVTLNNTEIQFNIIPTQSPTNYIITFMAPEDEGPYDLSINGQSIALTVETLKATIEYLDAGLSNELKTQYATYGDLSNHKFGIIDESKAGNIPKANTDNLTLLSESDSRKLIFLTKKISNLKGKEQEMENDMFFNKEYMAINSYSSKPARKRVIIDNPEIEINTTKDFGNGMISLKITLHSISNGKKIISIEENSDQEKGKTIYS